MSSEIDSDSDESHKTVSRLKLGGERLKAETRLIIFPNAQAKDETKLKSIKAASGKKQDSKQVNKIDSKSKLKNQMKKVKQSPRHKVSDGSQKEGESDKEASDKKSQAKKKPKALTLKKPASALKKSNGSIKRKKSKDDDKGSDKNVVTKKRMASLNASAILAANYEIENYAAKHESSSTETSASSSEDDGKNDVEPPTLRKEKKDVKMESEEVFLLLFNLLHLLFVFIARMFQSVSIRMKLETNRTLLVTQMMHIC